MARRKSPPPRDSRGLTGTVDNIEVDWPRSLGFFGGIGAAIALDLVPLPIGIFIAGVPFLKLFNRPNATRPQRFIGHVVDGAATPVGGDAEGTIRWAPGTSRRSTPTRSARPTRSTRVMKRAS
ncbi:MAG TPA: hypothetical protein VJT78_07105 [Candidatus Dormibacteraeota bacterium]|nr:hypothetical protein [Candidatus Dormibacteraeota bacterium]